MTLYVYIEAFYISCNKIWFHTGGYLFFSSQLNKHTRTPIFDFTFPPPDNGAVYVIYSIIKNIFSYTIEAEINALFYNTKHAKTMHNIIRNLGYPLPPMSIQADNKYDMGIDNYYVKQRRSTYVNVLYYWISDRVHQGYFHEDYRPGTSNYDYFVK